MNNPSPHQARLRQLIDRIPRSVKHGGSVQQVRAYKEWVAKTRKQLNGRGLTESEASSLINQWEQMDKTPATTKPTQP